MANRHHTWLVRQSANILIADAIVHRINALSRQLDHTLANKPEGYKLTTTTLELLIDRYRAIHNELSPDHQL